MGKSYFRLLLWVYALALVICMGARILLVHGLIDYSTGFYAQKTGIATVFNICLLLVVLFQFVLSRLRKVDNEYPVHNRSRAAAVLSILTGLSIPAFLLLDSPYPFMEQGYPALLLQVRDIASLVLGFVAALAFIMIGVSGLIGSVMRVAVVPALFTSIWQVYMLVTRFNSYTTLTTISDNLLTVLFMLFSTLFLMGHARTVFGFSRKDGRNYTIPAGLCASLFGLVLVIPQYVHALLERSFTIAAPMLGVWESVYILFMSLYALVFVVGMVRSIKLV